MSADLDVLVDELYALPLERFVPERGVLAKQLRAEGRREEAARVAALDKPSIAAWAVNQVVRAQRSATEALWDAGDAVLATQAALVDGRADGQELRAAIDAERRALDPLADAARGLVTGSGRFLGDQHVGAVVETLHAAAIDPTAREQVASARLVKPLRLTGLEAALAAGARGETAQRARLERRRTADQDTEATRRAEAREDRARRQALEQALLRAERARDDARGQVTEAAALRDQAAAVLERARTELAAAEEAMGAAEDGLAARHAALEQAEEAAERARAALEDG